ncbi:MAG: DUF3138 family protein [Pseudomonadota bacterium]
MPSLKISVLAIAFAFPGLAFSQTTQELKAELEALKNHVKQLEAMIEKVSAKADAKAEADSANVVEVAEFNRIRIKTEAMEDQAEASGFKGLKVSGYVDPTYIYNRNANTSSFVFLNNNSSINGSGESFGYDNTFFGSAMLNVEKELDGGTKMKLSLMPSKSTSSGYNFGNLVHEASVSVPLGDLRTRLIAGQIPDWSGYEYIPSTQNKLITHNLLFDFSAPNFYTGAGLNLIRGKWDLKGMIGNMNSARIDAAGVKTPGIFYRGDYAKGEFAGFGFAGIHSGFDNDDQFGRLDIVEVDGYFVRGDMTLQGQLTYGRQAAAAFTGERSSWSGLSGLAAYKITPRLEGIARFDYINNRKQGGGVFGATLQTCEDSTTTPPTSYLCGPDGRNGFGPGMVFDGTSWGVEDSSRGSNRYALSLGVNYALMPGVSLKGEYRVDSASGNVFLTDKGDYRRNNHVFGVSTVVSF